MNFVEAARPFGGCHDGLVRRREEVAVAVALRLIYDDRRIAVALNMRAPSGVSMIAHAEFEPELADKPACRSTHKEQITPRRINPDEAMCIREVLRHP